MSTSFPDRVPSSREVIDMLVSQRRGRGPNDGHVLTLSETAIAMQMRGHFDKVPSKKTIMELEKLALAKARKALKS